MILLGGLQSISRRQRRRLLLTAIGAIGGTCFFLATHDVLDNARADGHSGHSTPPRRLDLEGDAEPLYQIVDLRELMLSELEEPREERHASFHSASKPTGRHRRVLLEGPTLASVPYGPYAENVLDFWRASGDDGTSTVSATASAPRPLVIFIHGGGWRKGDKQLIPGNLDPAMFLKNGISFASINYRLTGHLSADNTTRTTLPAPIDDAIRAIKFIKHHADDWNIDADRIALTGMSAGAATAMYIIWGDNQDFAIPDAEDLIERESTTVRAAAILCGQATIDPFELNTLLGPGAAEHKMIYTAIGEEAYRDMMRNYDQHKDLLYEYSPINHIGRRTSDPAPLYMEYMDWTPTPCPCEYGEAGNCLHTPEQEECIHHPMFGRKIKERCEEHEGVICYLKVGKTTGAPFGRTLDFLLAHLRP